MVPNFCCYEQKIQKMNHLLHFNEHTSSSKHLNLTNGPIFLIYSLRSIRRHFHFCVSRHSKFSSMGSPPPLHYVLVCKIQIYIPKMILPSLLTSLLAYKPINLLTFSVYFGNNMVAIPRTTLNNPEASNFIKKRLWHRCFSVNLAEFLRTPFYIESLRMVSLESVTKNSLGKSGQGEKPHITSIFPTPLREMKFSARAKNLHIISPLDVWLGYASAQRKGCRVSQKESVNVYEY